MSKPKRIDLAAHQAFIDATFAKRRAEFGHGIWFMEDDANDDSGGAGGDADKDKPGDQDADADKDQSGEGSDADKDSDLDKDESWLDTLDEKQRNYVLKLKRQHGDYRVGKKEAEKKATESDTKLSAVLKALGLDEGDDEPTADDLAKGLTEAQTEARNTKIENQVIRYAATAGVNADALLDRNSFTSKFKDFDPAADDFADQVKTAINEAVQKDNSLKVRVAGQGGAPVDGGSGDSANDDSVEAELRRIRKTK